ncbi:hypothetical protein ABT059_22770 [Micromonospora tulbaghiae]
MECARYPAAQRETLAASCRERSHAGMIGRRSAPLVALTVA